MRFVVVLLALFGLAACYEVKAPVVAETESAPVAGFRDGTYKDPDGKRTEIRWNAAQRRYDVGAQGVWARAVPLGRGLYMVEYQADSEQRILMLASAEDGRITGWLPEPKAEKAALARHDVRPKPGVVTILQGPASAIRAYLTELAGWRGGADLKGEVLMTRVGD